jgi:poly-beta-1,6-N-acetyl-D-glucosamine biosynthesis protein PgaD
MWGAWLKLWYPLLHAAAWTAKLSLLSHLTLTRIIRGGSIAGVPLYAVALLGTSGTLVLWSRLPAFRRCSPRDASARSDAPHARVPEQELAAGRAAAICVVHHDDEGRIVRVETHRA